MKAPVSDDRVIDDSDPAKAPAAAVKRGRGRPRSSELEERIQHAVLDVLAEHGFSGLTLDKVCARAGVPKATFYRRWSTPAEAAMCAVQPSSEEVMFQDTGDAAGDLRVFLDKLIAVNSDPLAGACRNLLLAEFSGRKELAAQLVEMGLARRASNRTTLNQALARQGLADGLDGGLVLNVLNGLAYNITTLDWPVAEPDLEALIARLLGSGSRA
jgi:AcrR family transcriptional regulator